MNGKRFKNPTWAAVWARFSAEQKRLAEQALRADYKYLSQIARGDRQPSTALARRMAEYTGKPKKEFRPDIWG